MSNFQEYTFILPDGTKRYEMIDRTADNPPRESAAFAKMHGAVKYHPTKYEDQNGNIDASLVVAELANEVPDNALYPVCTICGSDDVTMDAVARWDIKQQTWIMSDTQDFTDCQKCGGQCNIKYVP